MIQLIDLPLISIIIPVYNTSLYLEECLLSIITQTYKNLEIICVDDVSTDNSIDIIKKYQKIDNRITLLNYPSTYKINSGAGGKPRNIGLHHASGKYIMFIDSDDYLEKKAVETLIPIIDNKFDICIFNAEFFNDQTNKRDLTKYLPIENLPHDEYYNISEEYKSFLIQFPSPCLKVYSSSFLKKKKILFPEYIVGEDVEFWFRCLLTTNKITYADFILYKRRYREGSVMTSNLKKNIKDRIDNFRTLIEISQSNIYLYNYILERYIPYIATQVYKNKDNELLQYLRKEVNKLHKYKYKP